MLFIFFYVLSYVSAAPEKLVYSQDEGLKLFDEFIKEHNKQYDSEEREERFKIFLNNLKDINDLNEMSSHATFGITRFADLTKEEFSKLYTGHKSEKHSSWSDFRRMNVPEEFNYTIPDEFDWRSKGVVSRVKDQGHCGSCWAFSTTGNVESINAIKTGKIVEISKQQLIDCSQAGGCAGGSRYSAYIYLVKNGAMSSQSYPYKAKVGQCNYNSKNVVIKLKQFLPFKVNEESMKKLLYSTGPLSISLAANALQKYTGGILAENCNDSNINHDVLLVGYGEENGVPFWLIKNSWKPTWGEDGYFRIKRGVNCLRVTDSDVITAVI